MFNASVYKSAVHPDSLQQFFRHTLTEVLTYNPLLKGRSDCPPGRVTVVCPELCPAQASLNGVHLEDAEPEKLPDSPALSQGL